MANDPDRGLLADVTRDLVAIFRHMLPGVLVLGGGALAYPEWFENVDLKSWAHLVAVAVVSAAAGNTWFALNRSGLHQIVDYVLWRAGSNGPARTATSASYVDDLGRYARKSLHTASQDEYARAREHVAFRASAVLLILTVGELSVLFAFVHSSKSIFEGRAVHLLVVAAITLAIGTWQMVITRRIDYYVVNRDAA
jgi:hypothetical protein